MLRAVAALLILALLGAGCGGKKAGEADERNRPGAQEAVETGLADAGKPVRGGDVIYAIEAETQNGWCLPDAQLAISGITVARSIYDTLTVPNDEGRYVPWLAESVEPNATFDEWTIELRDGVTFHDGSDLDSTVVRNNLQALRGLDPDRPSALGSSVFHNIADVEVVNDLTLRVTTHGPWIAFPAYLWSNGRYGIMAQSQLDDPDNCNKDLVGTGPFEFEDWVRDRHVKVKRNENYWRKAPDGKPYPYLDSIEFRPIIESEQRINALESGDIDVAHTSSSRQILRIRELQKDGRVNMVESVRFAEVGYVMYNSSAAPFDDLRVRRAMQMGFDRKTLTEKLGRGVPVLANGPFAEGVLGHVEDTGWPEFDQAGAEKLIAEYLDEKGMDKLEFTLTATNDPEIQDIAATIQSEAKKLDPEVDIEIEVVEQSKLIDQAIGGRYQATLFRNHAGGDPDTQYVWWKSMIRNPEGEMVGNFVNFGRMKDPEIDRLLDEGRVSTDQEQRQKIYEDLSRRFADQAWNGWLAFTRWCVAMGTEVHGIYGPELPDGSAPNRGLATAHSMIGMWTTASD